MKSQSSIEFLILASIMFLFFVGLVAVVGQKMIEFQVSKSAGEVQDIMDVVQSELQLAATSVDGYQRNFTLPPTINGREYEMGLYVDPLLEDNTFLVFYNDKVYETSLSGKLRPDTNVYKGRNFVLKEGGVVWVNSSDPCKAEEVVVGLNSYCLGGTCYCKPGFYDSECGSDSDGVDEDDFIVDHCGYFDPSDIPNNKIEIDCVAIDPCNQAPFFNIQPTIAKDEVTGDDLIGETNVTITFYASERVYVEMNYEEGIDEGDCDKSTVLTETTDRHGPVGGGEQTIDIKGFAPETEYCAEVKITDPKGLFTTSDPDKRIWFETPADATPPQLNSVSITPTKGYLGTQFNIELDITEASGLRSSSKLYVNRTGRAQVDAYDLVYNPATDKYPVTINVEDNTDPDTAFFDPNASVERSDHTTFLARYDTDLESDYPGSGTHPVTSDGFPLIEDGRFRNAVYLRDSTGDNLEYPAAGILQDEGTVEFWIKSNWDYEDTDPADIYYLFDASDTNGDNRMFIANDKGVLIFGVVVESALEDYVTLNLQDYEWDSDSWYYITAVWNINSKIGLYVNGTGTSKNIDALNPGYPGLMTKIILGYDHTTISNFADSRFDHVVISDIAKVPEVIRQDMTKMNDYTIDLFLEDDSFESREVYIPGVSSFKVNFTDQP